MMSERRIVASPLDGDERTLALSFVFVSLCCCGKSKIPMLPPPPSALGLWTASSLCRAPFRCSARPSNVQHPNQCYATCTDLESGAGPRSTRKGKGKGWFALKVNMQITKRNWVFLFVL